MTISSILLSDSLYSVFFFFNDTATTEIYTLSLHDALPISSASAPEENRAFRRGSRPLLRSCSFDLGGFPPGPRLLFVSDRKSTRLNSSHSSISYAVFCLKKKIIEYILAL